MWLNKKAEFKFIPRIRQVDINTNGNKHKAYLVWINTQGEYLHISYSEFKEAIEGLSSIDTEITLKLIR